MKSESFWSQDKLYFYATCVLFPSRLNVISLDAKQMNDFFMDFEDFQTQALIEYQEKGMLKVQIIRKPGSKHQFIITNIVQSAFKKELIDYLEKYREDELLPGFSTHNDLYNDAKKLLYAYLRKSQRKYPTVNPRNIWGYAGGQPFWEAILVAHFLDGDIDIRDIEVISAGNLPSGSMPRVELEIIKSLDLQLNADAVEHVARLKMTQLSFSKWRVYIELNNGDIFPIKDNLTEGNAPYSLLQYLVDHPGKLVTLKDAKQIKNCGNIHKLGEKLRQCHFNDALKKLVFDECGNTEARLKKSIHVSRAQLKQLGLKPSEQVGA